MKKTLYFLIVAFSFFLFAKSANAGPYLSVYAGFTVPHDANVTNNVTHETGQMSFHNGLNFGAKAGYWFTDQGAPYLGLQLDANTQNLKIRELIASTGVVAPVTSRAGFSSLTANLIYRAVEGDIRPYIGAGAGVFYMNIGSGQKPIQAIGVGINGWTGGTDTAIGYQVLAGLDFLISKRLSFFGEYKFSTAKFSLDRKTWIPFDITYKVSQVYGGLTYNF
ncbi:MAG: outer membrane beta-barrel protein [Deltaproteobacteria bacterium]|nr:outer membrane beta-barrel protein [Deltaproteobacteria bacterium]